ncbi:uncharacterized protein LOC130590248 [Beta vulgaris subsp. vulgaris]|uniref:uncharacterized protein LOC130590248 n=1 Tax=Beta vulgaris subsp. vulgaris TaxID=3555 RepID=UPI00254822E9|nr:uncharacterized protein LOC130590248 [Beta vulgaris subsp. vulgaris]
MRGPWQVLCNALTKNQEAVNIMKKGIRKQLGDGHETLFWHDQWIQETPLKQAFPRLFRKALHPLASVASMRAGTNLEEGWEIPWSCPLRPRDQREFSALRELLKEARFSTGQPDQVTWLLHKSGTFSVNSFYLEMYQNSQTLLSEVSRKMWCGLVPFRIEIFVWLALLERINTRVKLAARNIIPSSESNCPLCSSAPEDTSHLFLHCPFARMVWVWWCGLWDLSWVWPLSLEAAYAQWSFPCKNQFFQKVWNAAFQVIIWSIWKERNSRIFTNLNSSAQEVQTMVLLRLSWWIKTWKDPFPYSSNEILRTPQCLSWQVPRKKVQTQRLPTPDKLTWVMNISPSPAQRNRVIGGALFSMNGEPWCAFSCLIPYMDDCSAETLAIHRSLQISLNNVRFRSHQIEIESHSKEAVSWCLNPGNGPWNLQFILNFIRSVGRRGLRSRIKFRSLPTFSTTDVINSLGLSRKSDTVVWMN